MITHHFSSQLHRKFVENGLVTDGVYTPPTEPLLLSDMFDDLSVELLLVGYCPGKDELCSLPEGLKPEDLGLLRSFCMKIKQLHRLLLEEKRTIKMVTSFELEQPDPEPEE